MRTTTLLRAGANPKVLSAGPKPGTPMEAATEGSTCGSEAWRALGGCSTRGVARGGIRTIGR